MDLTDYINDNYVSRSTFALFTAPKETADINTRISRFRECAKKMFKDNPYIFVLEQHEKGGYHIHALIFNVGKLDKDEMERINGGIVKLKEFKPSPDLAKYLAKYITKDRCTKRSYYFHNLYKRPY